MVTFLCLYPYFFKFNVLTMITFKLAHPKSLLEYYMNMGRNEANRVGKILLFIDKQISIPLFDDLRIDF